LSNAVGEMLEVIILNCAPVKAGLFNEVVTILVKLDRRKMLLESVSEDWHTELMKARKVTFLAHDLYDRAY
jgi:hypothetical protein